MRPFSRSITFTDILVDDGAEVVNRRETIKVRLITACCEFLQSKGMVGALADGLKAEENGLEAVGMDYSPFLLSNHHRNLTCWKKVLSNGQNIMKSGNTFENKEYPSYPKLSEKYYTFDLHCFDITSDSCCAYWRPGSNISYVKAGKGSFLSSSYSLSFKGELLASSLVENIGQAATSSQLRLMSMLFSSEYYPLDRTSQNQIVYPNKVARV